jgi:hypothetical protein
MITATANAPPPPLPPAGLLPFVSQAPLTCAIARVDRSGRLYDRQIAEVAGWRRGNTLSIVTAENMA